MVLAVVCNGPCGQGRRKRSTASSTRRNAGNWMKAPPGSFMRWGWRPWPWLCSRSADTSLSCNSCPKGKHPPPPRLRAWCRSIQSPTLPSGAKGPVPKQGTKVCVVNVPSRSTSARRIASNVVRTAKVHCSAVNGRVHGSSRTFPKSSSRWSPSTPFTATTARSARDTSSPWSRTPCPRRRSAPN